MGIFDSLLDGRAEEAERLFNDYQKWYETLDHAKGRSVDITLGGLRVRCFGDEEAKQAAWDQDWRSKNPEWGPVSAGTVVSSEIPELWCDLRHGSNGELILPPHVLGHELSHALKLKEGKLVDPDTLIKPETYRK